MDPFLVAVIALSAGAVFGAANSVFGWIKNNNAFSPREFAITVVTGIIAGIGLVYLELNNLVAVETNFELLQALGGLALGIFGVNFLRTVGTEAIRSTQTTESTPTT